MATANSCPNRSFYADFACFCCTYVAATTSNATCFIEMLIETADMRDQPFRALAVKIALQNLPRSPVAAPAVRLECLFARKRARVGSKKRQTSAAPSIASIPQLKNCSLDPIAQRNSTISFISSMMFANNNIIIISYLTFLWASLVAHSSSKNFYTVIAFILRIRFLFGNQLYTF